jgi:hypothetical protein
VYVCFSMNDMRTRISFVPYKKNYLLNYILTSCFTLLGDLKASIMLRVVLVRGKQQLTRGAFEKIDWRNN